MADEKHALYFGCWERAGHYLHDRRGFTVREDRVPHPGFPWTVNHLDTGLLKNGKHADRPDGRVFWTCGGREAIWYAFFWWDRSVDKRPGSNSGFYVTGFETHEPAVAFAYACAAFPKVVSRQRSTLVLQLDEAVPVTPRGAPA